MTSHFFAYESFYANSSWQTGLCKERLAVQNPANEQPIADLSIPSDAQVEDAIEAARQGQRLWVKRGWQNHWQQLDRLGELIRENARELAETIVLETGKPIREALGEVEGAIAFCKYFAVQSGGRNGEIFPSGAGDGEVQIRREPMGVVGAIIPWNFPLALCTRKLAPALAAGNAVLLKPSELTPLSALKLAELIDQLDLPKGLVSVLPGYGNVGELLVRSKKVDFISMTGSARTGKLIRQIAAEENKPVSLELGGKAPLIVFEDADLEKAAQTAIEMRTLNNGQTCVCVERVLVARAVCEEYLGLLETKIKALKVGDPNANDTDIGPKISASERDKVRKYINEASRRGSRIISSGQQLDEETFSTGYWLTPQIVTDVSENDPIMQEEVFGSVLPVMPFDDERQAVEIANNSVYGLSAYVYSGDLSRLMRVASALDCGEVFLNRSGPEELTGFHAGRKCSGIGGDDGKYGFELYSKKKTVYVGSESDT